ncbi:hypothetical protein NTGBS_1030003 [Candidatus Nitrotoga sp. BS]|nr:hypothetical protein NTGBS_1030003 [Candidatus Nitrotoga sp. BS]
MAFFILRKIKERMGGATQSIGGLRNIIIRRNALRLLSPYGVRLTRVLYVQSGGGLVADSVPASGVP